MVGYGTRAEDTPSVPPPPMPLGAMPPGAQLPTPQPRKRSAPPTEQELRDLLERHQGNVAAVGRQLGKERMQIHRWMQRYGIVVDEYRGA